MSTLRCCDRDDIESNLIDFDPCARWPAMDSEQDIASLAKYGYRSNWFATRVKYVFGLSRTDEERNWLNSARPLTVVGGISPQETAGLRSARGSAAKVNLAFFWLQEFIIRESLHGSFGNVGPPIVSRLQQYSSDGHLWFNSARKVSFIPFPFPHAQLASIFVCISSVLIPTLMLSKTGEEQVCMTAELKNFQAPSHHTRLKLKNSIWVSVLTLLQSSSSRELTKLPKS
ncbi:hypothetical protein THAOC_37503 [Thalassiosira oceanica]|uniref:Uncharacterized protein n=1 Tax=Thalassiosira oceanica TaxID=159749 RepID=K0R5V8_THAOC|nr:hypothetical protein THAOC_37503 [Thalassiosira oceanica]|eukprot:EJK44001.1 hypothetical protein THAOC_37503 [Thalassiosira oceanica]